jgi:hypothetical protein
MADNDIQWRLSQQTWTGQKGAGKPDLHLMIDFETFSSDPEACGVMAVAVIPFFLREDAAVQIPSFRQYVSMESNYFGGRDMSDSQSWWCALPRLCARNVYRDMVKNRRVRTLHDMEQDLMDYIIDRVENKEDLPYDKVYLWSRGNFDIAILSRIFKNYGRDFPIPFYRIRDARTFIVEHHVDESMFLRHDDILHTPDVDAGNDIRAIQYIFSKLDQCGFFELVGAITPECNRKWLKEAAPVGRVQKFEE